MIYKIQNIIFPSSENCTYKELYFRDSNLPTYGIGDEKLKFRGNDFVYFDTYFNSMSIAKWSAYSKIDNVGVSLNVKGKLKITAIHKKRLQHGEIQERIAEQKIIDTQGRVEDVKLNYGIIANDGLYSFSIEAQDEAEFFGGYYYTEIEKNAINPVNISIIICTFKREKYVYKNVKMLEDTFLLNEKSECYGNIHVVISDNAHTLDVDRFKSKYVHVYKNKNVGGAGGFTRGLIETTRFKDKYKITHCLLMDDDVIIQPESIFRTFTLLSLIKEEYKDSNIGGAMLRTDTPYIQIESGATWNAGHLISNKHNLNLTSCEAILYNEVEEKADYNAWWYNVIPIEFVREDNLPLPIFIRGDDVEYGLRNTKRLILMNGICVWHEPFEFKYSSSMFYYIFRNRLIDNSVRGIEYSEEMFLSEFKEQFMIELFSLRYKNAKLLIDGVNDFLSGIDWLLKQDGEELNKKIMSNGYKMQSVNELSIPFSYPQYESTLRFCETRKEQKKRKRCLNGIFKKPYKTVIVPVQGVHIAWFYRAERVLNYDYPSQKGFTTYFDRNEMIGLYKEYRKMKKNFLEKYRQVKKDYFENRNKITNIGFWNKYLNI